LTSPAELVGIPHGGAGALLLIDYALLA
jgi:hypothetical protein